MTTPKPGHPVRGSTTGRPIMALLDLLGRRWTLRVIWELRDEALTFRALRSRCDDVSPTMLNRRLAELRDAGIVAAEGGYALTGPGLELLQAILPLQRWADDWAARRDRPAAGSGRAP
ncbi:MAG: helix-turn-helix domain-containing protein [Alphaproteobacteria bacterium]